VVIHSTQSLLSAFFLFSAFVAPPAVAALFTAFVPAAGTLGTAPTLTAVALPPTLASAVPRGDGDVCRSLLGERTPSLSPSRCDDGGLRLTDCGGGDADLRLTMGSLSVGVDPDDGILEGLEGEDEDEARDGEVADEGTADDDDDDDASSGVSNSAGRTRGVAWTLVINFARLQ